MNFLFVTLLLFAPSDFFIAKGKDALQEDCYDQEKS